MQNLSSILILLFFSITTTTCRNNFPSETEEPIGKTINGQKQGEWKTYYKSGVLCRIEHYLNDTLNGPDITFDENGNIYTKCEYRKGELIDSFIHYFSNGNVNFRQWRDSLGKLQGIARVYFPNGQLRQIGYYKDGKMDSTWVEYDENGKMIKKEHY